MNTSRPRRFGLPTRCVLVGASLVAGLALAEVACRRLISAPVYYGTLACSPYPCANSDYLPLTLPPNLTFVHHTPFLTCRYETNSDGFRDDEQVESEKPGGETRVLLCGDSLVLGWGVRFEETFGEVAEAILNEGGRERFRVLNAGFRSGYTLDHYYAFLSREAERWRPDHVVVGVYLGNDLDDLRNNRWSRVDERGLPTTITTRRLYGDYCGFFLHRERYDRRLPRWLDGLRLPVLAERVCRPRPYRWPPHSIKEAVRRAGLAIRGIEDLCRERRTPLTWLLIPAWIRTAEAEQCQAVCRANLDLLQSDYIVVDRLFAESGASCKELYIDNDYHLTPRAHRIVAAALAETIRKGRQRPSAQIAGR